MFHEGRMYSASNDAVRRIDDDSVDLSAAADLPGCNSSKERKIKKRDDKKKMIRFCSIYMQRSLHWLVLYECDEMSVLEPMMRGRRGANLLGNTICFQFNDELKYTKRANQKVVAVLCVFVY